MVARARGWGPVAEPAPQTVESGRNTEAPKPANFLNELAPRVSDEVVLKPLEDALQILERRLDNVVYRAGFAHSRDMARQLVGHGHFLVNGKKVDIPSFLVTENDIIEVRPLQEFET